jgi:hypothetical protein
MDIPKTSLADQEIKLKHTQERKVKNLDSLYSSGFLNTYFSHTNTHQSSNKHS